MRALATACAILLVVLVTGCGGSSDEGHEGDRAGTVDAPTEAPPRPRPTSPSAATSTGPPTVGSGESPTGGPGAELSQFRKRCVKQTRDLDTATLFFEDTVELRLSKAHRFQVVLSAEGEPVRRALVRPRVGSRWRAPCRPG